ncbi:hypothetical protein TELCIR_01172 [Teladorsagia circumcincta]|uniref:Uncharacterized protein n=1 Tax=Teladorsagia circumcincta TaxID=45464 RepID=A0A2G9V2N3_TELCI|nr:hypothetical protein TELCIR_01172 [Teladorsagia circumcincta]
MDRPPPPPPVCACPPPPPPCGGGCGGGAPPVAYGPPPPRVRAKVKHSYLKRSTARRHDIIKIIQGCTTVCDVKP